MNNFFTILLVAQSFSPSNQQPVLNQSTINPPLRQEQSVLVDKNNRPVFNYAINADGTPIDLEPYFRHDPDAENRIQLRHDEFTHSGSSQSHDLKKD